MNKKNILSLILGLIIILILLFIVQYIKTLKKKGCGCNNQKLEDLWNEENKK